jgi:iron complex transport system ATP-binding protein
MRITHSVKSVIIAFGSTKRMLSSAPFSGGFREADTIVNIRTNAEQTQNSSPEKLITDFLTSEGLNLSSVGLLTAAQLEYCQFVFRNENGFRILAVVSAGTSNALNASEKSPTEYTGEVHVPPGTINTIVITDALLLDECMVSSVIMATEAKSAALFDLEVKSVTTGSQATGTGTDAIVIVSGYGRKMKYAGGHTKYGQLLGEAVYTGTQKALKREMDPHEDLDVLCSEFFLERKTEWNSWK